MTHRVGFRSRIYSSQDSCGNPCADWVSAGSGAGPLVRAGLGSPGRAGRGLQRRVYGEGPLDGGGASGGGWGFGARRRRRSLRGGERAAGRWEAVSHLIVARAARRVRWLPSVGSRRASALVSGSAVLPREGPGSGARSGLRACEGRPVGRSGVGGEGDPGGSLLGGAA